MQNRAPKSSALHAPTCCESYGQAREAVQRPVGSALPEALGINPFYAAHQLFRLDGFGLSRYSSLSLKQPVETSHFNSRVFLTLICPNSTVRYSRRAKNIHVHRTAQFPVPLVR